MSDEVVRCGGNSVQIVISPADLGNVDLLASLYASAIGFSMQASRDGMPEGAAKSFREVVSDVCGALIGRLGILPAAWDEAVERAITRVENAGLLLDSDDRERG